MPFVHTFPIYAILQFHMFGCAIMNSSRSCLSFLPQFLSQPKWLLSFCSELTMTVKLFSGLTNCTNCISLFCITLKKHVNPTIDKRNPTLIKDLWNSRIHLLSFLLSWYIFLNFEFYASDFVPILTENLRLGPASPWSCRGWGSVTCHWASHAHKSKASVDMTCMPLYTRGSISHHHGRLALASTPSSQIKWLNFVIKLV